MELAENNNFKNKSKAWLSKLVIETKYCVLKIAALFSMVGVLTILNTNAGPQMMGFHAVHVDNDKSIIQRE